MNGSPAKTLVVLLAGAVAATVTEGTNGHLSLEYVEPWRTSNSTIPLSLSMPISAEVYRDQVVRAFLWGLLPDSEQVLDRWAREFQVSARNPFALLRNVGEDCAGAVQLVTSDRVDELLNGTGGVKPVSASELAERIRILRRDPAAWHLSRTGQFSLAGAQAKTALYFDGATRQWGDPWGSVPTTHILKPAVSGFDDHDLNEHMCLMAASRLGLNSARSSIAEFDGERVIVVQRYDRLRRADTVIRVHQEDMCQAFGVSPTIKYQHEGGPSPEQIIRLLRERISPPHVAMAEVARFVDALAFNWIIAGTDAHAKNYSVLLAPGQIRLAPLYDIASALPYEDMYLPKLRMAMKIGGEYRIQHITAKHWRRFESDNALDSYDVVARVGHLAALAPQAFAEAARSPGVGDSPLPARLVDVITARTTHIRTLLAR